MKKISIKIVSAALLIISFFSCEKVIDFDVKDIENLIVLNANLMADSVPHVYITRTRHMLDNQDISTLRNVRVQLTDDESGQSEYMVMGEDELYYADTIIPEIGKSYTITAELEGLDPVTANCVIPEVVEIQRVDTSMEVDEWGSTNFQFDIIFEDPEGETNYYLIALSSDYKFVDYYFEYRFDTLYVDLEKDTIVTGWTQDTIVYENYYREELYVYSEDLAVEDVDGRNGFLVVSDKLFDGKTYGIRGSFYPYLLYESQDSVNLFFNLYSISESYYRYLRTRIDQMYVRDDPFAEPVFVHSNIENGEGIFGAASISRDTMRVAPLSYGYDYPYYYKK